MKTNKIIWGLVALLCLTTIAVSSRSINSNFQTSRKATHDSPSPTPEIKDTRDLSKYGIVAYDAPQITDQGESEKRRLKSQRYDNDGWVRRNPHNETAKVGRYRELTPPPVIPTAESDLIVIGKIVGMTTHLSNDKTGVYSEFKVKINQLLKNSLSIDLKSGDYIMVDRAGGGVRYPSGQVVLYLDGQAGLPEVGGEFAMFLRVDPKSENYEIVTVHELLETKTIPLDSGRKLDDVKRMGKSDFIMTVRDKLSRPVVDEEPRRKP